MYCGTVAHQLYCIPEHLYGAFGSNLGYINKVLYNECLFHSFTQQWRKAAIHGANQRRHYDWAQGTTHFYHWPVLKDCKKFIFKSLK